MLRLAVKQSVIWTNRSEEIVRDSCTTKRKEKWKTEKKKYKVLTAIVTDEVTVSSPVSGGSSVTGGALIGGASSEPVLSMIKKNTYCHYYASMDSTRIYQIWEGSCQRLPNNPSIEISVDWSAIHFKLILQSISCPYLFWAEILLAFPARKTKTFPWPKLESTLFSLKRISLTTASYSFAGFPSGSSGDLIGSGSGSSIDFIGSPSDTLSGSGLASGALSVGFSSDSAAKQCVNYFMSVYSLNYFPQ